MGDLHHGRRHTPRKDIDKRNTRGIGTLHKVEKVSGRQGLGLRHGLPNYGHDNTRHMNAFMGTIIRGTECVHDYR